MSRCWFTVKTFCLVVVCAGAVSAQTPDAVRPSSDPSSLRYATESLPKNRLVIDVHGETAYDDNVFGSNQHRVRDLGFQPGARIALQEQRSRGDFEIEYRPDVLVYRSVRGYNQLNHALKVDGGYRMARHFDVRLAGQSLYRIGLFQPQTNDSFSTVTTPPPSLNHTVFVPLSREFSTEARADAIYQKSQRSTINVFGTFANRKYTGRSSAAQNLFNTQSETGGLSYGYRLSRSTTVGTELMYQHLRFGAQSHSNVSSALLTVAWDITPLLRLSVFGGPQYAVVREHFIVPLLFFGGQAQIAGTDNHNEWRGSGGGNLTFRTEKSVVSVSAQRTVMDGGGILTTAVNTFEDLEVRRRLARRWDALFRADNARSRALTILFGNGVIKSQTAGLTLECRFREGLMGQVGYAYVRQRISGAIPFLADMDRNRVSVGIFYELKKISLGM